jgi:hypothetical protein
MSTQVEVSGQPYASAPLLQKNIGTNWIVGWLGHRFGLDILVKAEVHMYT